MRESAPSVTSPLAATTSAADATQPAAIIPAALATLLAAALLAALAGAALGDPDSPQGVPDTTSQEATASELAASPETIEAQNTAAGRPSYRGSKGHIQLSPPRVTQGPVVDGKLDDAVWQQAAALDSFTHGRPIEGVLDTLGTTCLLMYDDQNLYPIGARPRHLRPAGAAHTPRA